MKKRAEQQREKEKNGNFSEEDGVQVVKLCNEDLPVIVNGRPSDPIQNRPVDRCFTKEMVRKDFVEVGFVPPTCWMLASPKMCRKLGKEEDT